jgi:hypothetical protein
MTDIETDHRATSIVTKQSEAILTLKPNPSERQNRARSSAKQMRAALTHRPKLREIKDLLSDIYRVASVAHDGHSAEGELLETVTAYWDYLNLAGEDYGDRTAELEVAIKMLKAILAAKPAG